MDRPILHRRKDAAHTLAVGKNLYRITVLPKLSEVTSELPHLCIGSLA